MLIDKSYFNAEINIPNTDKDYIEQSLNQFIETYEITFLKKLLGYGMSLALLEGIQETTVDQRWNDILFGSEYTWYNRLKKWEGLIPNGNSLSIQFAPAISVVVDRGQTYDPVSGTNTVPLPANLIGKQFQVELRGMGTIRIDEYTTSGGAFTWLTPKTFVPGETLTYHAFTYDVSINAATTKKSLIANYVYWYWMQDQITQTVGLGEASTKAENATRVSPQYKMVRAWNENYHQILSFFEFMDAKKDAYPEWYPEDKDAALLHFYRVNTFGI